MQNTRPHSKSLKVAVTQAKPNKDKLKETEKHDLEIETMHDHVFTGEIMGGVQMYAKLSALVDSGENILGITV